MLRKLMGSNPIASLMHSMGNPMVIGLAYHGTSSTSMHGIDNIFGKHICADTFKKHLDFITKNYRVIPLIEIVNSLIEQKPLPRKSIFITFDDGYIGNYETAFQLLKEYDIGAAFFVPTHFIETGGSLPTDIIDAAIKFTTVNHIEIITDKEVDRFSLSNNEKKCHIARILHTRYKSIPNEKQKGWLDNLVIQLGYSSIQKVPILGKHVKPMNWKQIKEMLRNGMEIGSHSHRHVILGRVPFDLARDEILRSKEIIEKKLGVFCNGFSYPNGHFPEDGNEQTNQLIKDSGFKYAIYMHTGFNTNRTNPFFLTRCCFGEYTEMKDLRLLLATTVFRIRNLLGEDPSPQAIYRRLSVTKKNTT